MLQPRETAPDGASRERSLAQHGGLSAPLSSHKAWRHPRRDAGHPCHPCFHGATGSGRSGTGAAHGYRAARSRPPAGPQWYSPRVPSAMVHPRGFLPPQNPNGSPRPPAATRGGSARCRPVTRQCFLSASGAAAAAGRGCERALGCSRRDVSAGAAPR